MTLTRKQMLDKAEDWAHAAADEMGSADPTRAAACAQISLAWSQLVLAKVEVARLGGHR